MEVDMYDPYADYESVKLPNGLCVHVLHRPELTFAKFELVVRAGMVNDPEGKAGVAHFLEHMVCANSGKTLPELSRYFAQEGASFTANTSLYRTVYSFSAPTASRKFDEYIDFWTHALLESPLVDFFAREQGIIRSEIAREFSSRAHMQAVEQYVHLRYRGFPEGAAPSALGTATSFECITIEDLHEYKDQWYTPQNMHLVCTGGLSLKDVLEKIDDTSLTTVVEGPVRNISDPVDTVPEPAQMRFEADCTSGGALGKVEISKTILLPGVINFAALSILSEMLDKTLEQTLREEKGLVYAAGASVYKRFGHYLLVVGAGGVAAENVDLVSKLITEALARICSEESDLFDEVLHEKSVEYLIHDPTNAAIQNSVVHDLVMHGSVQTLAQELDEYASVTYSALQAIAPHLAEKNVFTFVMHK